jgi:tetratricopeptide (TPR) repeat protein
MMDGDLDASGERLEQAVGILESLGDHLSASRWLGRLALVRHMGDRLEEALELNRRAVAGLPDDSPQKARALVGMAQTLYFAGDREEAFRLVDAGLVLAEPLEDWPTIERGVTTVAMIRSKQGRLQEARALLELALALALEHDLGDSALRAYNNLADLSLQVDRYGEALTVAEAGLELAKARGHRSSEQMLLVMTAAANVGLGRWDGLPEIEEGGLLARSGLPLLGYLPHFARVHAARGNTAELSRALALANTQESANVEYAQAPVVARAIVLRATGQSREALEAALPVALGPDAFANEDRREAIVEAGLAALELDDEATVERLIEFINARSPALRPPLLRAAAARLAGLLAARRGDLRVAEERLDTAAGELREVGAAFLLAQVLLEQAELLVRTQRGEEAAALLVEASSIFERLHARPWVDRARSIDAAVRA